MEVEKCSFDKKENSDDDLDDEVAEILKNKENNEIIRPRKKSCKNKKRSLLRAAKKRKKSKNSTKLESPEKGCSNSNKRKHSTEKKRLRSPIDDDSDYEKYNSFRPGEISDNLREALGLGQNELPPYVYLMRNLGYPPGWLEYAKIMLSDIDVVDSSGNHLEIEEVESLDPDKIIDYPGFNAPMDEGVVDNYEKYGVQPFIEGFDAHKIMEMHLSNNLAASLSKLRENCEESAFLSEDN